MPQQGYAGVGSAGYLAMQLEATPGTDPGTTTSTATTAGTTASGGLSTLTVAGTYTVGQAVQVAGVTPTGYNGIWTISAIGSGTISFQTGLTSPSTVTVQGTVSYRTWTPDYLPYTANTLDSVADTETAIVALGTRNAEQLQIPTYKKQNGAATSTAYPNACSFLYKMLLGADTVQAAVPGTVTSLTTANGITTVVFSGGPAFGAGAVGKIVQIGTGAKTELRPILTITPANGTTVTGMTLPALVLNADGTTPAVSFVNATGNYQHCFRETTPGTPGWQSLPTAWMEDNSGAAYAYAYSSTYVTKLQQDWGKDAVKNIWDIYSTKTRGRVAASAYPQALQTASAGDPFGPFTGPTQNFIGYCDPNATGTGTSFIPFGDIETAVITLDNDPKEKALPGQDAYRMWIGIRKGTLTYTYINEQMAAREWEDFIVAAKSAATQPFLAYAAINQGTVSSPLWTAISVYIPSLKFLNAKRVMAVDDVIGMDIACGIVPASSLAQLVQINVVNASSTAF